jgi:hypothetical protein
MAVFDRIEMAIVSVPRKIVFVPNHMFPVLPLPDTALRFAGTAEQYLLPSGQGTRKRCINQPPAECVIRFSLWQGRNSVEVVWQHRGVHLTFRDKILPARQGVMELQR